MAPTHGESIRVLATGVRGDVAKALVRQLRDAGCVVDLAERGDDLSKLGSGVAAVVVLEGTEPTGTDYPMALRAAASAMDHAGVGRLISVMLHPYTSKQQKGPFLAARRAESALVAAGYPVEVIRAGFLVGSPGMTAPADAALFADGSTITHPGDGRQRLRPLLLEDLGKLLVAAVLQPRRRGGGAAGPPASGPSINDQGRASSDDSWALLAEGPDELSVRSLLEMLNPGVKVEPRRRRSLILKAAVAMASLVAASVTLDGWNPRFVAALTAVVAIQTVVLTRLRGFTPSELPTHSFRLRAHAPASLSGVPLQKLTEVWSAELLAQRGPRRELARGAKRYGVTPGSYWVAGFLLLFAVGAGAVGLHDLFLTAPSAGARLTAFALTTAAGITAFGGVALLTRWPSRYVVGFVASVLCVATLVIVPAAAVVGGDPSIWNLFAIYVIPAGLACCVHLWKRGGLQVKNVLVTRGEKLFGSVVVGGSLATVAQLLYGAVYLPATAKPSVSGDVQLAVGMPVSRGSPAVVTATIKMHNDADRPVVVLAAFPAHDSTVISPAAKGCRTGRAGSELVLVGDSPRSSPMRRDTLLPSGARLDPDETVTARMVFPARRSASVAAMRVDLAVARPRYRHDRAWTVCVVPGWNVLHYVAKVEDHTWLHDVTRSTRYVHLIRAPSGDLGCNDRRQLAAYVDGTKTTGVARWCGKRTQLSEHYGLVTKQFSAEAPVRQAP